MSICLIVANTEKVIAPLSEILMQSGFFDIEVQSSAASARRTLLDKEYDMIIINTPLSDETGIDLSIDICENYECGVLLLVKAESADQIQERVEEFGVFVVPKPLNRQVFFSAVKFVMASRRRILAAREKENVLLNKIEDIKIIDRAKCCLIEYRNMTENEAHRYIEKQAMDQRKLKRSIADEILQKYKIK